MHKKLLAAALGLAFAAPVFADASGVVLYGRLSESLEHNKTTTAAGPNSGQGFIMRDNASRLGVKGSEDLGGGLSAIFAFEFGVAADNNQGINNGRHSYVGFKGDFGTLVFGKQDGGNDSQAPLYNQAQDVAYGVSDNEGALTTVNSVSGNFSTAATGRDQVASNSIGYATSIGDVQINARHAMVGNNDTGAAPNGENNTRQTEVAATYVSGPVTLGGGIEYFGYTASQAGTASKDRLIQLVGAYDFGVAKASLIYGKLKLNAPVNGDDSLTDYRLSTWVPFTGNTGLTASYGRADQIVNPSLKSKTIQIATYYDFSKRTRTYFGINQSKQEVANTTDTKRVDVVLGLRHNF